LKAKIRNIFDIGIKKNSIENPKIGEAFFLKWIYAELLLSSLMNYEFLIINYE